MTTLSVSEGRVRTGGFTGLAAFRAKMIGFAELFGAAVRVSRAVEAHKDADPRDLKLLGINGELPKAW